MIILKVTKNQAFTLSLEDTILKKPQGRGAVGWGGGRSTPAVLGLRPNHKIWWRYEQVPILPSETEILVPLVQNLHKSRYQSFILLAFFTLYPVVFPGLTVEITSCHSSF